MFPKASNWNNDIINLIEKLYQYEDLDKDIFFRGKIKYKGLE